MSKPKILVVYKSSNYSRLVSDKPLSGVVELIEAGDELVSSIVDAHRVHDESIGVIQKAFNTRGLDTTWCHLLEKFDPDSYDLVVTVGGDGTVLHASHSVNSTPVLGVNSSPATSVGFLTGATAETFGGVLDRILTGEEQPSNLARMQVAVNDLVMAQHALNDVLFCHDCPASTTRYLLTHNGTSEAQLSSGVWISTAAGSTAAIFAAGGRVMPAGSRRMQFVVREPFPGGAATKKSLPKLIGGFVADGEELSIRSKTAAARVYVDGPHVVIPVGFGDVVTLSRSPISLSLYGYRCNKSDQLLGLNKV